jgi:hypothetical protein
MSKKKLEPDWTDFRNLSIPELKIDVNDPANLSSQILPEQEYRVKLLSLARQMGCERDILLVFAKYDKLMRTCTNEQERIDIGKMGVIEMYRVFGGGGYLIVNGELVCKDN